MGIPKSGHFIGTEMEEEEKRGDEEEIGRAKYDCGPEVLKIQDDA